MHFSHRDNPKNSSSRLWLAALVFLGLCISIAMIIVKFAIIELPAGLLSEKPNEIRVVWYSRIGFESTADDSALPKP